MYHGKHCRESKKNCEYKAKCVVTIKCKVSEKRPNGHVVQTWPLAQGGRWGDPQKHLNLQPISNKDLQQAFPTLKSLMLVPFNN